MHHPCYNRTHGHTVRKHMDFGETKRDRYRHPHTRADCQSSKPIRGTTMKTLTEHDIERNMRDVAHAIAQQELEGLKVPEPTVADLRRVARGEIDTDEVIRNIHRRIRHDPIFRP